MGFEARKAVEQHYTWDKTARIWEELFDSLEVPEHDKTWYSPAKIHHPNLGVPAGLSDEQFVRWGMVHIAGRPDLVNSYVALRMTRDLTWGVTTPHFGGIYFNEDSMLSVMAPQQRFRPFDRN